MPTYRLQINNNNMLWIYDWGSTELRYCGRGECGKAESTTVSFMFCIWCFVSLRWLTCTLMQDALLVSVSAWQTCKQPQITLEAKKPQAHEEIQAAETTRCRCFGKSYDWMCIKVIWHGCHILRPALKSWSRLRSQPMRMKWKYVFPYYIFTLPNADRCIALNANIQLQKIEITWWGRGLACLWRSRSWWHWCFLSNDVSTSRSVNCSCGECGKTEVIKNCRYQQMCFAPTRVCFCFCVCFT